MLPDAVQTAVNVQEFVLRAFLFTYSTASSSKISTKFTGTIRQEATLKLALQCLPLRKKTLKLRLSAIV
jgi:hypothetical protein